jgi:hypothetical protein
LASVLNVLTQQAAGCVYISLAAEIEELAVFFVRSSHAVGKVQLQARVSLAAVIDVTDNGKKARTVGL